MTLYYVYVLQLYQTPEFQQCITAAVCRSMNFAYKKFCAMHPGFPGDCSIIGHSLGSVITFDILSAQLVNAPDSGDTEHCRPSYEGAGLNEEKMGTCAAATACTPAASLYASQSYMTEGRNSESVAAQQLVFKPTAFYAIGSPIGKEYVCMMS